MHVQTKTGFLLLILMTSQFMSPSTQAKRRTSWVITKRQHKTFHHHTIHHHTSTHRNMNHNLAPNKIVTFTRTQITNGNLPSSRNGAKDNNGITLMNRKIQTNRKFMRTRSFYNHHKSYKIIHQSRVIPSDQKINRRHQIPSNHSHPRNSFRNTHTKVDVHSKRKGLRRTNHRPQTPSRKDPDLTNSEKMIVLKMHNKFRTQTVPLASDMLRMTWDENLAALALSHAKTCAWHHSEKDTRKNKYGYKYIGENLFASTARNVAEGIQGWADEIKDYNYWKCTCVPGKMCYHYTQMVWAKTIKVGCAVAFCPKMKIWNQRNVYYLVCNYGPGGNYVGRKPFTAGKPCQSCPRDRFCLKFKLCKFIRQ